MKHFTLLSLFITVAAITACEDNITIDEPKANDGKVLFTLKASSEDVDVKTTYTDAGAFSWSANDEISVLFNNSTDEKFFTLTNTSGAGTTATFQGTIDDGYTLGSISGVKWALYPASDYHTFNGTVPVFYIPSETDFTSTGFSANIPLMAIGDGENLFAFKQLGPTYKFTFTGIDEGISNVKFVMENTSSLGLSGNVAIASDKYIGNYGYFLDFSSSNTKTVSCTRAVTADHEAVFYVPCRYYGSYTPTISLYDASDLSTPIFTQTATAGKTLTGAKVKRITIPVTGGVWSYSSKYKIDWSSVSASGVGNTASLQSVKATAVGDYIYLYLEVQESALLESSSYANCTLVQLFLGGGENAADWKWSNNKLYNGEVKLCWLVTDGSPAITKYGSNDLYNEGYATVHSGTVYYEIKINRPTTGTYSYLYSDSKAQIGVLVYKNWTSNGDDYSSYYYGPSGGSMLEVTYP